MKNVIILIVLFCTTAVFAVETFTVSPFIVLGNNNKATLNFQTAYDINLSIKITVKNKNNFFDRKKNVQKFFAANEFQKIEIENFNCDNELSYTFTAQNNSIIKENSLTSIPCNKDQPLYFGFMSDTQIKDPSGQKRAETISATVEDLKKLYPFSVIVNAGDVVQHGGRTEDWNNFFTTAYPYLKDSYIFAAVGNHDYFDSPIYEKAPPQFRQYLRDNISPDVGYAALDLGRVTIIMLNSNFDFMNETTYKEQWNWLINQLNENQKINKPVIVSMHHSPFSSSVDYVREIPSKLRAELVPTLEKYSCVKMMISGHLHMYERSQKGNIPYLVAGPSGGIINYITYANPYKVFIKPFVTTFSVFKVTDTEIDVTTFTGLKEMIDHFSVKL